MTDPLEAKDRNTRGQGHNAEAISEKKGLGKFFEKFKRCPKNKI